MLAISFFAARWILRRFDVSPAIGRRFAVGLVALALLLFAEFTLVLWLRGISISEYFATRDPITGAVYYTLLLLFALMPIFVVRK